MEELVQAVKNIDSDEAEEFFARILGWCGIQNAPTDWRERIRVGSDRKQSGTARENLVGLAEVIPEELPDTQKEMVEVAAPGVRRILGYA
jgi:hypothetical protein